MAISFKKTCFECGAKVDSVMNGLCIDCYKKQNPPVKEIKPLNLKVCNSCKKIHYNNQLLWPEKLEEMLPDIMKGRIILNQKYSLDEIKIENFEIIGNKVCFDLKVGTKFEE